MTERYEVARITIVKSVNAWAASLEAQNPAPNIGSSGTNPSGNGQRTGEDTVIRDYMED